MTRFNEVLVQTRGDKYDEMRRSKKKKEDERGKKTSRNRVNEALVSISAGKV